MNCKNSLFLPVIYGFVVFLTSNMLTACHDENPEPDSSAYVLAKGETKYLLDIYDSNGKKVLSRKGEISHMSSDYTNQTWFNLSDPLFGTETESETFAGLGIAIPRVAYPTRVVFGNNSLAYAAIHQEWYSMPEDWAYTNRTGMVCIKAMAGSRIKGEFEISMEKGDFWPTHPEWGSRITIKGSFLSEEFK